MQVCNYEPSVTPSIADQTRVLGLGLGRVYEWARTGWLAPETLRHACLKDLRYDKQVTEDRSCWLWPIAEIAGHRDELRKAIFHAAEVSDSDNSWQHCKLLTHFARSGDLEAIRRLKDFVCRRGDPGCPSTGEEELVSILGEEAVLLIAQIRGQRLSDSEFEWGDSSFIDDSVKALGDPSIRRALLESSSVDVQCFAQAWQKDQNRTKPPKTSADGWVAKLKSLSAESVTAYAHQASGSACNVRSWGQHADDASLSQVQNHLLGATEPQVMVNLLKVFSKRQFADFDARLYSLVDHADENVRRWASNALDSQKSPRIRELAIQRLENSRPDPSPIGWFALNLEPGDEDLIFESLRLPDDDGERHSLLFDVVDVLEANPTCRGQLLALAVYGESPCENCRYEAVKFLMESQTAPAWLVDEARYDSHERTRALANGGKDIFASTETASCS